MTTITRVVQESRVPQFPALLSEDSRTLTYAELARAVDDGRKAFEATGLLGTQSVITSSLINGPTCVLAFLATGAHRCIAAPLNPGYTTDEVLFYLEDAKPDLLLVHRGAFSEGTAAVKAAQKIGVAVAEIHFDMAAKRLELNVVSKGKSTAKKSVQGSGQPKPDDVALLLHTSGTTGRPKAVPLTHGNLTTTMQNIVRTYSLSPMDRSLCVCVGWLKEMFVFDSSRMPLFHVHGLLASLLAPLASGGSVVVPPKFSASTFWRDFQATECTWYSAVPTMHQILLRTPIPKPLPAIRFIRSCSSALSPTAFREIEKIFQAPVLEAYAMTEAAHQMTSNPLPPASRKPGSVGLPQGVELRILDDNGKQVEEGEVCSAFGVATASKLIHTVRGANVTKGYLNNPAANKSSFTDGFFRTGDRGKLDKEGYLFLTGRIKELINRGGEKLSPLEIDAALLAVEGINEAISFGVPDEKYGEKVWAGVVLKDGVTLTEAEIRKSVGTKLSKFKVPERVFITDSIPKAATGKVQRRLMAPRFLEIAKNEPVKAKL